MAQFDFEGVFYPVGRPERNRFSGGAKDLIAH